ncbi:uncharacterized protein LOC110237655 [Exaiptasia diaphana]|uniref:Ephrin RBD domain-containing protein n=1 Tax=Exaiptasia diaphana TaxID=2652724 RepID=A0A913X5N8_EXADI|nr:uncharacterized protein LOC110237655 [Exaiptasia diaphana]KXJ27062.1 Ephrin-B2a [Exaiptasia diaphana]
MFWTETIIMVPSMLTGWLILEVILLVKPSVSLVYPSVQWTPRNPIFQKPENSRVINVQSMSRINIVCPNTATNVDIVQDNTPKEWLYENLWIVSKNSYDNCNASSPKTDRLLLRCDTPLKLKYYTIFFLQYSATIQGLEFPVGKEYYFIATSDGTKASLGNSAGGNCARGSMKIKFYVCKGPRDPRCQPPTTSKKPQSNNIITYLPTTAKQPSKHFKTKQKPVETNSIPVKVVPSPTTQKYSTTTTTKNEALQSDDPRMTLNPTLSSQGSTTVVLPETTTVDPEASIEHLLNRELNKEPCTHDHGTQPSWNVVIPLLVVIFILVIMNSFVICRLKQNNKSCLAEDNLNNVSTSEKRYSFKNNNRKASSPSSSPVMV